jgi:MFS family permease
MNKRDSKEQKEIWRLQSELDKPKRPGYLYYLLVILCFIYIMDEITSQIGYQMQSIVAQVLFAPTFGIEVAVARMSALSSLTIIASILAFVYKTLSDRFGRKIFLTINTLGMGAGLFVISLANSIPVYIMGAMIIAFFIPHDMQAVYIIESVPAKYRATIFSAVKTIATLGVLPIPFLRDRVMGSDITKWRYVYRIPSIFAVVAAVAALFFARETETKKKKNLEYLQMSEEKRKALKEEKDKKNVQGGFIPAIKFCIRHKQLKWLMVSGGFILWGTIATLLYETTMTYGYASEFLEQGMSIEDAKASARPIVTQALFCFPIGSAFFTGIQGVLSDRVGRKTTIILMSILFLFFYSLFFYGANNSWDPHMVGLLCGAAVGSFWAAGDHAGLIMCAESAPTNLRASVLAVQPILSGFFFGIAFILSMIIINIVGDSYAGTISLAFAIPGQAIGLTLLVLNVRETKGVNLENL